MKKTKIKPIQKKLYLNPIAQLFLLALQEVKALIAGRGFGKSFINGIQILQKVENLPRSKGLFLGLTYTQILGNTLLPMINAWEWFGYIRDVDYVIGKKPPKHFQTPFQKPERYENVITFFNGTTIVLGSFDRADLNRGGSNDWIMVDEALLIKKEYYDQVIIPTLRPSDVRLKDMAGMLTQSFTSSMPFGSIGSWLFDIEKDAKTMPDKAFWIEGTSWHNRVVIGDETIKRWIRTMSPLTVMVEINNKRIRNLGNLFYPALNADKHYYDGAYDYGYIDSLEFNIQKINEADCRADKDCDKDVPLDLGFDFGAFNCCVVGQEVWPEFKLLNSFHVSHPEIVEDLVEKIADYYQPMRSRIINLYGDKAGNNREPNSRMTSFQKIQKILRDKGFRPVIREMGDVGHYVRHEFFNTVFRESDPKYPHIRINKVKNPDFIIAMESAGMHSEKKDKRPEHHAIKQEHATHYTDAFDQLVYWKYRNGKIFHAMRKAGTAA